MRNRHTGLVRRGLHKLKEELRNEERYKVVYNGTCWVIEQEASK